MRGATLYLNDMLEEREREQRRRTRKAFAGAIVVALLGLAAAMRPVPPPQVIVKWKDREIERVVTQIETVEKPTTTVPAAATRAVKLLPFAWPPVDLVALTPLRPRHLCA